MKPAIPHLKDVTAICRLVSIAIGLSTPTQQCSTERLRQCQETESLAGAGENLKFIIRRIRVLSTRLSGIEIGGKIPSQHKDHMLNSKIRIGSFVFQYQPMENGSTQLLHGRLVFVVYTRGSNLWNLRCADRMVKRTQKLTG